MIEFERKPDGGLNAWIETYEAMGGDETDAEMLCLLLELRRRRENQAEIERERDELITQLSIATERAGINFDRAKLVALMIRKFHAELLATQQEQSKRSCGKCGDQLPVQDCPCKEEVACWVNRGWHETKLVV